MNLCVTGLPLASNEWTPMVPSYSPAVHINEPSELTHIPSGSCSGLEYVTLFCKTSGGFDNENQPISLDS